MGWPAERHCDEGVCAFHNGVVGEILLIPWLRKPHIHPDSKQAALRDQRKFPREISRANRPAGVPGASSFPAATGDVKYRHKQ